jgi:hypothetical protein
MLNLRSPLIDQSSGYMFNCRNMFRFALTLTSSAVVMAVALPAAATGEQRVAMASVVVQRAGQGLLAVRDAGLVSDVVTQQLVTAPGLTATPRVATTPAPAASDDMGPRPGKAKPLLDYKAILGGLVITRDLHIPGAPTMAVRLIPSSTSITGEDSSPIVFTPRVVGSSWYGLDVAARF